MTDVDLVAQALTRILEACRPRRVRDPESGVAVSPHQARILMQLDDEDPAMVTELADFLGVTASTMSLNLKRLREAGLVVAGRDPDDRRVMNVLLTEAGVRARDRAGVVDRERLAALLQQLRSDDRDRALRGLATLAEAADVWAAGTDRYVDALTGGA